MIEFPVQPAMIPAFAHRAIPEKTPAVAPVKGSSASGQSALQNSDSRSQQQPTDLQRHLAKRGPNSGLVGPPPSFQANVLEVESDIKRAIERLEEKREKSRNRDAAAPAKPAEPKVEIALPKPDVTPQPTEENPAPVRDENADRLA